MCYTLSNNTGIITVLLIHFCYYQVVIKSLHSAVQNILLKTFHMQFDIAKKKVESMFENFGVYYYNMINNIFQ